MINELTFKTNSKFQSVAFNKDAESWYFVFTDKIAFNVSAFWRLLSKGRIQLVSLDNGHQFGLPKPIDLLELLANKLTGKFLLEIKVKPNTADLILTLTDNIQIEIFISSAGYETYNFSVNEKNYIGMGAGDIKVFDEK